MGKSLTVSSLGIPQDGNVARVLGCSDAIRTAGSLVRIRQEAHQNPSSPGRILCLYTLLYIGHISSVTFGI